MKFLPAILITVVFLFLFLLPTDAFAQECQVVSGCSGSGCTSYTVRPIPGVFDIYDAEGYVNTPTCKRIDHRIPNLTREAIAGGLTVNIQCPAGKECNEYMLRTAICGSSEEVMPACAPGREHLSCWGNNYRRCTTSGASFPEPAEGYRKSEGYLPEDYTGEDIIYNGQTYDTIPNGKIWFCDANVENCGPGSAGGEGESRIWFSSLRAIAFLSTALQAMLSPGPSALINNTPPSNRSPSLENKGLVTTRIEQHQGETDGIPVINTSTNNSSLKVGGEGPDANFLLNMAESPYNGPQCVLPSIDNPGDDLVGPEITAKVLYTQKYEYDICTQGSDCTADGAAAQTTDGSDCCSSQATGQCHADPTTNESGVLVCGRPFRVELPSKGKIAVFIRNPLVEYINNVILTGVNSLFGNFAPLEATQNIQEIPTAVAYAATAKSDNLDGGAIADIGVEGGGSTPVFYVPHAGSLKQYFLGDLQKALRPKEISGKTTIGPTPSGECVAPDPDSSEFQDGILAPAIARGEGASRVPQTVLKAIYSIESLPYYTGAVEYNCTPNSLGYLGLMQIGTDRFYGQAVPASMRPETEERQCNEIPGKLNRCNPQDAMEIAARILLVKVSAWPNGQINSQVDVRLSSCRYYGSDNPDQFTQGYARGHFEESECRGGNCNNMSYADIVCLASGFCNGRSWPQRLATNCQLP